MVLAVSTHPFSASSGPVIPPCKPVFIASMVVIMATNWSCVIFGLARFGVTPRYLILGFGTIFRNARTTSSSPPSNRTNREWLQLSPWSWASKQSQQHSPSRRPGFEVYGSSQAGAVNLRVHAAPGKGHLTGGVTPTKHPPRSIVHRRAGASAGHVLRSGTRWCTRPVLVIPSAITPLTRRPLCPRKLS